MSGQIDIRRMRADDIMAVAHLRSAAFFEGTNRTIKEDAVGLAQLVDSGFEAALVAESNGQIIGTALLVRKELDLDSDKTPWLAGLAVAPSHRRLGIGSRLIYGIEVHAKSIGCETVYLYTYGKEPYYSSLGWVPVERVANQGSVAVLMCKNLGQ